MNIIERLKTEKIAVHCDTEEKANAFLKLLYEHGFKWRVHKELTDHNNYNVYLNETCYKCEDMYVLICGKVYFEKGGYEIITFDEFMNEYNKENKKVEDKQETNYERYREEIDNHKHGNEDYTQCYVYLELMGNGICPKNTGEYCCGGEDCFIECVKWLSQPYEEPKHKIKLT